MVCFFDAKAAHIKANIIMFRVIIDWDMRVLAYHQIVYKKYYLGTLLLL